MKIGGCFQADSATANTNMKKKCGKCVGSHEFNEQCDAGKLKDVLYLYLKAPHTLFGFIWKAHGLNTEVSLLFSLNGKAS